LDGGAVAAGDDATRAMLEVAPGLGVEEAEVWATVMAVVLDMEVDGVIRRDDEDGCTTDGPDAAGVRVAVAGGTGVCDTQMARLVQVCGATSILRCVWLGCVARTGVAAGRFQVDSRRWACVCALPWASRITLPPGVRGGEGMRYGLCDRVADGTLCEGRRACHRPGNPYTRTTIQCTYDTDCGYQHGQSKF
jgi:hypothetical protein